MSNFEDRIVDHGPMVEVHRPAIFEDAPADSPAERVLLNPDDDVIDMEFSSSNDRSTMTSGRTPKE